MLSTRKRRAGFTLAEVLVAVFIVAALAAVTVPTVKARLDAAKTTALSNELRTLRDAMLQFRTHVGRYPSRIRFLANAPVATSNSDPCGTAYTAANVAAWRGPYVTRYLPNTLVNYSVGDDYLVDMQVTRAPAAPTAGSPNFLQITVTNVEQSVANDLQADLEGDTNLGAGIIIWTGGVLTYQIPIGTNATNGC
jgi:general secretion pathway protein G